MCKQQTRRIVALVLLFVLANSKYLTGATQLTKPSPNPPIVNTGASETLSSPKAAAVPVERTGGSTIMGGVTETLSTPPTDMAIADSASATMSEDFEGTWPALGWDVWDQSSSDGGEYVWGKRDCHPHNGAFAGWAVGGGAQGSALDCSDDYPNNADIWAVYGPFDLSSAYTATLTFHLWGQAEVDDFCSHDYLFVSSSKDRSTWSGVAYCGNWTGGDAGNGYYQQALDLSDHAGESDVWVGFAFRSNASTTDIGFTVDDVTLDVWLRPSNVMYEDFESGWPAPGWRVTDRSASDGGEYLWGKRDCHPRTGSFAGWAVGGGVQGNALACDANHPSNAHSWAVYGPFDLSMSTDASLTFHLWGQTAGEYGCSGARLFVGSSTNGADFLGMSYCGDWTGGDGGNGYYRQVLDLSNRAGESEVWLGFGFISYNDVITNGFIIDDVNLGTSSTLLPSFDLVWTSTEEDNTESVAWGDYDHDGDLDLAVGNGASLSDSPAVRLYRNDGGTLTAHAVWSSDEDDDTYSVAWGDYDGDGDLDLVVGSYSYGYPTRLHRNDGVKPDGTPRLTLDWTSTEAGSTTSVAWGDYDGDGDLDLVVGNYNDPTRLYRNNEGMLAESATWSSVEEDATWSVAWEDYDGDGDLDLAVGNIFAPPRLYRNDSGTLTANTVWSPTDNSGGQVAWGDYDGDGDPDLAVDTWLYRNDGGTLTSTAVWISDDLSKGETGWVDYDGDDDLDLAVGTRLYRNLGGILTPSAVLIWDEGNDIAWGDYDGDGDLDLVVGKDGRNRLYRNNRSVLSVGTVWSSTEWDPTVRVAWGDYDGDGDLDLAAGNYWEPANRLYRNDGDMLTTSAVWSSDEGDWTRDVAWGDYDGDGDLDLVVGNVGSSVNSPARLYRNDEGTLSTSAVWSSIEWDSTESVAWGDYDGDGDLDLAVGNTHRSNRLYRNDGGILTVEAVWSSVEADDTQSVAWGDYDDDGDLDLAVRNYGAPNRLYRNDAGLLTTSAVWSSIEVDDSNAAGGDAAWGDYDGDGDLDLAMGNTRGPIRLYRNDSGMLTAGTVWSPLDDGGDSVAWGDYDGDGDLDLVVGSNDFYSLPSRLYRNDSGVLTSESIWLPLDGGGSSVAWGDYDGDGDLDLMAGHLDESNRLYRNMRDHYNSAASIPILTIDQPGATASADFYASSRVWAEPTMPITYTLFHRESAPVWQVQGFYSLNGGGRWHPGVATSDTITTNLDSGPHPTATLTNTHVYRWDIHGSGLMGQYDNVVFRLVAIPAVTHKPNGTPGPYQYGSYASSTFPFRVRGSQVRVISGTMPMSNAIVYRLPAGQTAGAQPYTDLAGEPFRTDGQGYLQGQGEIGVGDQLLALAPVRTVVNYEGLLEFDGADDYVIRAPLHNVPITETTVSFWMRSDDVTGSGTPVSYATPGEDDAFLITDYNNFTIHRGSISVTAGITATDGFWHHIAVTWRASDGEVKLYKDGFAAFTGTLTTDPLAPGGSLVLGQDQDSVGGGFDSAQAFQGLLDEVQIWSVVRTEAEIQTDMFWSPKGDEPSLVAYWPFNDNSQAIASDQSVNDNDGVLKGATWEGRSLGGYTLYYTNGQPTETGLDAFTVTAGGVQILTVTAERPLILFDLHVSLEWDAHNDPVYLQQLAFDLQKTSAYLYDFTDGQAALGQVTVHQNGDYWHSSHVAVQASNRLRPFAIQGGIVVTPTQDPEHEDIVYDIGHVRMGATWNRYGTPGQNQGVDWPLTLAHELSHFLFFQEDVYLGLDDDGLLIPVDTCTGSVMGDMYDPSNTEFVYDLDHWSTNCADTLANRTLARTEWETLRLWYPDLVPATVANTGPSLMPFDFTTIDIQDPITPTDTLIDPTFYIDYVDGAVSSSKARAFILRDDYAEVAGNDYVIDLGSPTGGQNQLLARGARPGDRLCISDSAWQQYGCEVITRGDDRLEMERDETWTPLVQISPVTPQTIHVEVGNLPAALALQARLYPDYGIGGEAITLTHIGEIYSGTFHLDSLAMAGHVQVWVDETATEANPRRETIVAYVIGGNPGRTPSSRSAGPFFRSAGPFFRNAGPFFRSAGPFFRSAGPFFRSAGPFFRSAGPFFRSAGPFSRAGSAPLVSPDGQMTFYTENPAVFSEGDLYVIQNVAELPPLPAGKTAVGQGYSLVASSNVTRVITGSISFQYLTNDVLLEGADEDTLTIHYWNGEDWQALGTVRDAYYNLASAPSQGGGIYTLLAGVTTPHVETVAPAAATNDVTTTLTIGGGYFLQPVEVTLLGPTATYTLPVVSVSPVSITAVVSKGLPAHEYQVVVANHNEPGGAATSPTPGVFALYDPADACFYDFFESGTGKWERDGTWDIVILPTGERAMTDSPTGNYDSAVPPAVTRTTSITSTAFSLGGCENAVLTFRHDYVIAQMGASRDVGRVEISTDDGATWAELAAYSGGGIYADQGLDVPGQEWTGVTWQEVSISLAGYTGTVRLRFSLEVDQYVSDKGWVIDDVMVNSGDGLDKLTFLPLVLKNADQDSASAADRVPQQGRGGLAGSLVEWLSVPVVVEAGLFVGSAETRSRFRRLLLRTLARSRG